MDKKEEKELDDALKNLCEENSIRIESSENDKEKLYKKLKSYGFADIEDRYKRVWFYSTATPTEKGKEFYRNGGFRGEKENKKKNEKRIKWANIRSWIAIILSAIAIIVAILK
ncbi:MAG: hypothetical protein LKH27_08290 [Prevotella sp.]|jgi:hypothetical protein|nr:hypothetical protein [Prevotella sp.]MCH3993003.1 hypothetical protein [Prevotella sp.]MCI1474396.1 hypothetical protein [Prevotella sp.]